MLKFGICSYLAYCREEKFPVFLLGPREPSWGFDSVFFFKKINFYCGRGLVRMYYINKLWKNSESQMGDWIHDLLNTGLIFYRLSYKDFDGSSSISFVYGTLRIISWSLGTKVEIWRYERSSRLIRNLSNCEREAWKKKFRLQRDSNPWPLRYRCSALPTELWSHALSGMMDPLKLTCSQQLWLHSSVGRALHRYRRGHGFESRCSLNFFFQASLSQLLKLRINCEDLS